MTEDQIESNREQVEMEMEALAMTLNELEFKSIEEGGNRKIEIRV